MNDGIAERIAAALERQVAQVDEQLKYRLEMDVFNLKRIEGNRAEDLARMKAEREEEHNQYEGLLAINAQLMEFVEAVRDKLPFLRAIAEPAPVVAVDPQDGGTPA